MARKPISLKHTVRLIAGSRKEMQRFIFAFLRDINATKGINYKCYKTDSGIGIIRCIYDGYENKDLMSISQYETQDNTRSPVISFFFYNCKNKLCDLLINSVAPHLSHNKRNYREIFASNKNTSYLTIRLEDIGSTSAVNAILSVSQEFYKDPVILFGDMSTPELGTIENNIGDIMNEQTPKTINLILYGPPGTGKTYNLQQLFEGFDDRRDFITFHQSYSYEEFIEGIRPVMDVSDEVATDITYRIEDGIFKKIARRAKEDPDNQYALFIDEINRGNISKIFGELITLVELDKRLGADNELTVTLPYSKEQFGVPKNLSIIGTMNTADRSIALVDIALRRRFEFKEMMPEYNLIPENVGGINVRMLLQTINRRIEYLYDRDHVIGHAYLMKITSAEELRLVFFNKIIPLLQEYFYGDWKKVCLVLGCPVDEAGVQKNAEVAVISAEMKDLGYFSDEHVGRLFFKINDNFATSTETKLLAFFTNIISGPGRF